MKAAVLLLGVVLPIRGQVEVGITGGVPLTRFVLNNQGITSAARRYTVGPSVELHIRGPVGIEASALYKRFGFNTVSASFPFRGGPITESIVSHTTGNSWEFPIFAKAHLRLPWGLNGFVSAGLSIRRLTGITEVGQQTTYPIFPPATTVQITDYKTDSPVGMDRRTSVGAAIGAGFQFRAGPLHLAPEFRVTRWDSERTSTISAATRLDRTQAEVLLTLASAVPSGRETPPARIACCFEFGLLTGLSLLTANDVRAAAPGAPTNVDSPARRFAMGALLDWRFHDRLSLEGSFVVRPFGYSDATVAPNISTVTETISGYSWEVPLLLKWRAARIRSANFVIGAGPAIWRGSNGEFVSAFSNSAYKSTSGFSFTSASSFGATVSGAAELSVGRVRLRPELRYSWFERPLYDFYYVRTRQDSLMLIFAVTQTTRRK